MGRTRKDGGREYLDERGGKCVVRVQVPKDVRNVIGRGELKRSLRGGFDKAAYHRTVDEFLGRIAAARRWQIAAVPELSRQVVQPTHADIELACYSHFRRMISNLRGKVSEPVGDNPASRGSRIEGYRMMVESHVEAYEADGWTAMTTQVDWLCEENGWQIEHGSPAHDHFCQIMLRARLQCYRDELRRLEGKMGADSEADPLFGTRPPKAATTLGMLVDKFKEARSDRWSASTIQNYVIIFRVLKEICGTETPLDRIDEDYCREVLALLAKLPANYQKLPQTRGRPVADAISIGQAGGLKLISPGTVKAHLAKLGAIIRYGRDKGWIAGNPMANVEAHDPIDAGEKRDPFSIEHLNAIFGSYPWTQGPEAVLDRPSRYWAPLIGLFSGGRLTEVCGQKVGEMIVEDGVRLFHFKHRPGDRTVKGGKSRKVPVHPVLIELGFWDFVEEARASQRENLFPDVSRDKVGKWGDSMSDWLKRKIKDLGLHGRSLTFHSFRHSFEDALRRADLHGTPISAAITGRWSPGVSKNYGTKYPFKKLEEAVALVEYPGLRIDHIVGFRRS